MGLISQLYNLFFYQPILNFLIFLYNLFKDFGLAVVFLTIFVRIILFPFTLQSLKMEEKINSLKKELKEIEKKYDGKEKTEKTLELYKKVKINPFLVFISFFLQFLILISLYQVFLSGVKEKAIDPKFLGFFDLSKPNLILAFFVAISQFFYSQTQKKESKGEFFNLFQTPLNFFLCLFLFLILSKLPSAIGVYLLVNFLFLILQRKYFHA